MAAEFIWLRQELEGLGEGDTFDWVSNLQGEEYRALEFRRTFALDINGNQYFVKHHRGTGTAEIVKNLVRFRLPVVSANNEWRAIMCLTELGVSVPVVAGYGRRGLLPWTCQSFIITDDVGTQENLEDLTRHWTQSPPAFAEKRALIREVAGVARTMHDNGICHRDFYLCHFLVKGSAGSSLTLIDLHRALVKKHLPVRWVIKDLGALYFSAMDIGLTQRDLFRFIKCYCGVGLRQALREKSGFWLEVVARARKLKARHG